MSYDKHYVPLESDPTIFTRLMQDLGVSDALQFIDVYSLDDDLETGPVLAVIVIFPEDNNKKMKISSFETDVSSPEVADHIIWFKQTINNACGLYAVLHAICNSPAKRLVKPDSIIAEIINGCRLLDPLGRTKFIHDSDKIQTIYNEAALRGRTERPAATDEVECHYVCFTKSSENSLWLLDGDRDGPVQSNQQFENTEDILDGAGRKLVQDFIKESGLSDKFNVGIMALVAAQ